MADKPPLCSKFGSLEPAPADVHPGDQACESFGFLLPGEGQAIIDIDLSCRLDPKERGAFVSSFGCDPTCQ